MLVLSRRKDESIVINDEITIVVVEVRGDKVRLGVDCPTQLPLHKGEVYEAIRQEGQQQSKVSSTMPQAPLNDRPVRELVAELRSLLDQLEHRLSVD